MKKEQSSDKPKIPALRVGAVIHRRNKWDTPKHPISATSVKCGCNRFAEKFSTGMGWVYVDKGKITELTSVPSCV